MLLARGNQDSSDETNLPHYSIRDTHGSVLIFSPTE